jgi:hypothetical protein
MTKTVVDTGTREARLVETGRQATAILIGAVVSGILVAGFGARLFMLVARLLAPERRGFITEAQARVGEVTAGGTFFLVLFVGLFGAIAIGWTLAVAEQWLGWAGRFLGVAVGVMLLLVFGRVVLEPTNFDFALLGDEEVTIAMISILYVLGGVLAVWVRDRALARLPAESSFSGRGGAYLPAGILAMVGLTLLLSLMSLPGDEGLSGVRSLVIPFATLVVITLADRLVWIARGVRSPTLLRIAGFVVTSLLVVLGGIRYVEAAVGIVP